MWERICEALSLGKLNGVPEQLHGGYMHRMYAVTTDQGRYAVKLLNPEIMARMDAMENYRTAEAFEARLEAAGLPVLPAWMIGGSKMQCVDGQYLYVFDYFDGQALKDREITPAHCEMMGGVLARIHSLGWRECLEHEEMQPIDWQALSEALLASPDARQEAAALQEAVPMLTRVTAAAVNALQHLPRVQTICHNDIDAKNVLWRGSEYRIIDLESLGWADPMQELLDLAVSWAGYPLEEACFRAFVRAYYAAGGKRPADAAMVFDSRRNHIDWLEYNVRRALFDDPQERAIGRTQIMETIGKITFDQQNREAVLRWMETE